VGADTAGHVARNAVTAAADTRASFPRTGFLLNTQGNQGTAAQAMPGQAGTRRFIHSAPRNVRFGGTGNVGLQSIVGIQPIATLEAGQTDNPTSGDVW
jgi:hypothetical protein